MNNIEKQDTAIPSFDEMPDDVLKRSAESWWRTQSATMALLKHAYQLVNASEQRIAEQEKHIQRLENLAATDPLTGLMNRRGFERFFDHELARIRRKHSPGALFILIDLDRFKPINDIHGHMAGDACLMLVAKKLQECIRMLDGAARIGGDEFALLFTQLEPEKAAARIQRVRKALNDLTLEWQGKELHFGASIGSTIVTGDGDYAGLYNAADTALYADKQQRRKQISQKS